MNAHILGQIFLFLMSALGLWYFFFVLFKDLAIDIFREKMFNLRDNLFDEASDGLIPFDHPAYMVLRDTMNGFLRFGHKISLFDVLIAGLVIGKNHLKSHKGFKQVFNEATAGLNPKQKERLESYSGRITELLLLQSFFGSPIFVVFLLIGFVLMKLPSSAYAIVREKSFQLLNAIMKKPLDRIEMTALAYGQMG